MILFANIIKTSIAKSLKNKLLLVVALFVLAGIGESWGQLSISSHNTTYTIDFDNTVAGVNSATFNGSGSQSSPAAGQLDSDGIKVLGHSDGDQSYGGSFTTGDHARGQSTGGVTTGGVYAFNTGGGDYCLGIQPGGTDWTPGDIRLKLVNNTGSEITSLEVTYEIKVRNDQDRSNCFNLYHSSTDVRGTNVSSLDYTSTAALEGATWYTISRTCTLAVSIFNGSNYYLNWYGNDVGGSGSRDEFGLDDVTIKSINAGVSDESDIICNISFTEPTNIDYISYQEDNLTSSSLEVARFDIRDGGGTSDADALGTSLTAVTFSLSNWANVKRVALYDGTTEKVEVAVSSGTVTFSSISGLSAGDNSSKTFKLLASFNSSVTDNQQFQFTITSATANGSGSTFAAGDAGGASSSITGDRNRIEVTATKLLFVQQPTDANTDVVMSPAVTVEATDDNNRDLDYSASISVTSTGTMTDDPISVSASSGLSTYNSVVHTVAGTGLTLSASSGGLTGATSTTFTITEPPVTLAVFDFDPNDLEPNTGAIGSPTLTASATVTYYAGHSGDAGSFASANGKYFELTINTVGYEDISVSWWGRHSSATCSWDLKGDYGSGYGGTLVSHSLTTSFTQESYDLSSDYDNNSEIKLKWTAVVDASQTVRIDDINITGVPMPCLEPTTQASGINFSSIGTNGFNISWTNGNGSKRAVFIKEATTGTASPVDNTTYTANTTFTSGSQIGSTGWYCVYNGTGTTVSVTGLTPGTTYRTMVCEYNCLPGSEDYFTATASDNPKNQATNACTTPTTQATSVSFSNVNTTGMDISWTNGNGSARTAFMKQTTSGSASPSDNTTYTASTVFGSGTQIGSTGWYCIYNGTGTGVSVTGLTTGTDYRVMICEYNCTGGWEKYNTGTASLNPDNQETYFVCTDEGFSGGITPPTDWSFTGISETYTSAGYYGNASPSLKFDDTGDRVETDYVSNPQQLSFWIRGAGTDASSTFKVEGYNGSAWATIVNIEDPIPTTGTTKTYNAWSSPALASGFIKFRFTYQKSVGNVAFDDVQILCLPCESPTTQSSGITFIDLEGCTMKVSWTKGNGTRSVVIMNTTNSFTSPSDGDDPAANATYGGSGEQVIFNGTGNYVTVDGLTEGNTYWFRVYDYNCTGSETKYITSTGSNNPNSQASTTCSAPTTQASGISFSSVTNTSMHLTWTAGNGTYSLVVCKQNSDISGTPVNNTEYTASYTFGSGSTIAAGEYVVYNGTSDNFTVVNLTASTTYYFKVYSFNCSSGCEKYMTTSPASGNETTAATTTPTTLEPGNLAILGLCSNIADCWGGSSGDDEISFVCFIDIAEGTLIDMTDNGWEREPEAGYPNPGYWGNSEGVVRATRTGTTIPAGTVITFWLKNGGVYEAKSPDTDWSFAELHNGGIGTDLVMNTGGDQIYFMQGGTWTDGNATYSTGTHTCGGGSSNCHNGAYTGGNVLFGFNSNNTWTAAASTQHSNLYEGLDCFSMMPDAGATDFIKFTGVLVYTEATQSEWIAFVNDPDNWEIYSNCEEYFDAEVNYAGGYSLTVNSGGFTPGDWTGASNSDWFNCGNWENMRVPDETVDVTFQSGSVGNECTIGAPPDGYTEAACEDLTINADRTLTINNSSSILHIYGDFTNNNLLSHSDGTVHFLGTADQTISGTGTIEFHQLTVNKTSGSLTLNRDVEISTSGTLTLTSGIIATGSNKMIVKNTATSAISGGSSSSFIFGNLRRYITGSNTYPLKVGKGTNSTDYHPADFINSSIDKTYIDVSVAGISETGNNIDSRLNVSQGNAEIDYLLETAEWSVIPDNPLVDPSSGSYGIRLYVTNIADLSASDDNKFCVLKRPDSSTDYADWITGSGTSFPDEGEPGRIYNSGNGYAERTGYTTFCRKAIGKSDDVLPVELLYFDAELIGNKVLLTWTTVSETNNDFFTIERSADAIFFDALQTVPGAGNSNRPVDYSAEDPNPLQGISYYRLKQTDYDGKYSYSSVISIINSASNFSVTVIPGNEGYMLLIISNPEKKEFDLMITDITGRNVYSNSVRTTADKVMLNIETGGLSQGIYHLTLNNAKEIATTKLFIR